MLPSSTAYLELTLFNNLVHEIHEINEKKNKIFLTFVYYVGNFLLDQPATRHGLNALLNGEFFIFIGANRNGFITTDIFNE